MIYRYGLGVGTEQQNFRDAMALTQASDIFTTTCTLVRNLGDPRVYEKGSDVNAMGLTFL